jgi:hypothetical protein
MVLLALVCVIQLLEPDHSVLARLELGVIAIVSLLLFEALWFARPWVGRVVDAWVVACTAIVVHEVMLGTWSAYRPNELMLIAIVALLFMAAPCTLLRWYVRHRAAGLGIAPVPWDLLMLRRLLARVL